MNKLSYLLTLLLLTVNLGAIAKRGPDYYFAGAQLGAQAMFGKLKATDKFSGSQRLNIGGMWKKGENAYGLELAANSSMVVRTGIAPTTGSFFPVQFSNNTPLDVMFRYIKHKDKYDILLAAGMNIANFVPQNASILSDAKLRMGPKLVAGLIKNLTDNIALTVSYHQVINIYGDAKINTTTPFAIDGWYHNSALLLGFEYSVV